MRFDASIRTYTSLLPIGRRKFLLLSARKAPSFPTAHAQTSEAQGGTRANATATWATDLMGPLVRATAWVRLTAAPRHCHSAEGRWAHQRPHATRC